MDYDAALAQAAQYYGVEVNQLLDHALRDSGEVVLILPDGKKVIYTPQSKERAAQEEETITPEETPSSALDAPQARPQRARSRRKAA